MGFLDENGLGHLWGKVKSALAAKQDELTGQPGQVVGFDGMGLAYAVRGWSNPNLLDNWYFVDPVNQKEISFLTSTDIGVYTIDRWRATYLSVSVEKGNGVYLSWDNVHGTDGWIDQLIELQDPVGKQFTLSVMYDGKFCAVTMTCPSSGNVVYSPVIDHISPFIAYTGTAIQIGIVIQTNEPILFSAMKFELGSVQTLAHQDADGNWVLNDPPPDKALEALKCQRYYRVFSEQSRRPTKAVDFCPPMRINPVMGTINIDGVTYYTADANL